MSKSIISMPRHLEIKNADYVPVTGALEIQKAKEAQEKALKSYEEEMQKIGSENAEFKKRLESSSLISIEGKSRKRRKIESLIDKRVSVTSLIELEEAEDAIHQVEKVLGFECPNTLAYYITIKLWHEEFEDGRLLNADGSKSSIIADPQYLERMREAGRYKACAGLVIGIGPDAFQDAEKFPTGPACRIGDFVTFKLHNADQSIYKGFAVCDIPDDKLMKVINDPKDVAIS